MEKHLSEIYERANKEIDKKTKDFWAAFEKKDEAMKKKVESGKINEEFYNKWRNSELMSGEHLKGIKEVVAAEMVNADKTAAAYVNGKLPEIYSINYNAIGNDTALKGYSFNLVDEATVRNLATSDKTLLPYKKIDGERVERWNTQKVNAEVMQGIIQGESIPNIAKRMKNVVGMEKNSAIRNARTTTTSAENKGRIDSYHDAQKQGIILKKRWVATHDPRTREEHLELDGQEVDVDEPFENSFGKIMYPGDPDADPANVYNCRCTLVSEVKGFARPNTDEAKGLMTLEEQREELGAKEEANDGTHAEKWYDELNAEQKDAIEWYVSGDGMEANNYLRQRGYYSGGRDADDFLKSSIKNIDDAIEDYGGLKEDQVVYRALDISDIIPRANDTDIDRFIYGGNGVSGYKSGNKKEAVDSLLKRVNDEYTDKGFMSTTKDKDLALDWGDFTGANNAVVLQLDVPKGAKAADLKMFDMEDDPQNEVLFARNTKYEIYDIGYEQGVIVFKGKIIKK